MFDKILQSSVQEFISNNESSDLNKLLLKGGEISEVPIKAIVEQIISRIKAKSKTPFLYHKEGIVYPPKISMEQCSSEITAHYKAGLVRGKRGVDLTGGLGIDSYFLSKKFEHFDYVEQNNELAALTTHNFLILGANNINSHNTSAETFIHSLEEPYDLIYLDPARRDEQQKKVFMFEDCTPNIVRLAPDLFKKSDLIVVKASPLVDIKLAIDELKNVHEVHVVAVNNECKELLFVLRKDKCNDVSIVCSNYRASIWEKFEFKVSEEESAQSNYSEIRNFIYEPNASILKSGGFKVVGQQLGLNKLHPNTHLYTSDQLQVDFPGRTFEVVDIIKYDKKAFAGVLKSNKANITTRNFPDSVDKVRQKLRLKDGGSDYLFATTDKNDNKLIILTKKVV